MITKDPKEFVERVKAYCDKATPGPWEIYTMGQVAARVPHLSKYKIIGNYLGGGAIAYYRCQQNVEFTANSRTDLPAACELIEQQAAEIEKLDAAIRKAIGFLTRVEDEPDYIQAAATLCHAIGEL